MSTLWTRAFSKVSADDEREKALQIVAKLTKDAVDIGNAPFLNLVRTTAETNTSPLLAALEWTNTFQRKNVLNIAERLANRAGSTYINNHRNGFVNNFERLLDAAFSMEDADLRKTAVSVIVNAFGKN